MGAACFVVMFTAKWERESFRQAVRAGETTRIASSLDHLTWIGRESSKGRLLQGDVYRKNGNALAATHAYRRALELHPTSRGWISLAKVLRLEEDWGGVADAYDAALAIDPARDLVLHQLGLARLKLDQPERAREAFEKAAELNPDRSIHQVMLERAEQRIREARDSPEGSNPS